jgi:hypothetical protein
MYSGKIAVPPGEGGIRKKNTKKSKCVGKTPVIMLISTALLLDSIIRNSVCTLAKLPCRRVVEG